MPIADVGFAYASGIYQLNSNEHICSKSYAIHIKIACKMTHPDDSESQNRDEISDLKSEEIRNSFVFQMSSVHRIIHFQAKHVINTNEKMSLTFGPAPRQKKNTIFGLRLAICVWHIQYGKCLSLHITIPCVFPLNVISVCMLRRDQK